MASKNARVPDDAAAAQYDRDACVYPWRHGGDVKACMDCSVHVFGLNKRCGGCKAIRNKAHQSKWRASNIDASRQHRDAWAAKNADYLANKRIANRDAKKASDKKRLEIKRGGPARTPMTQEEHAAKRRVRDACRSRNTEAERLRSWRARNPLADSQIASRLEMKVADCPPGLIALKREQMQLSRLIRELNKELKETK